MPDLLDGVQSRLVLSVDPILEKLETIGSIIIVTNETETVRKNKIASLVCFVFGAQDVIEDKNAEENVQGLMESLRRKLLEKVIDPSKSVFAWGYDTNSYLNMFTIILQ